jgi:hypothetical protein
VRFRAEIRQTARGRPREPPRDAGRGSQATRPGGFRVVDVERFRRVRDRVNWGRVVELARAYNAVGLVLDFIRVVGVDVG